MSTPITDVAVGDYVIVQNPYRNRFGVQVEKLATGYFVGRVFSIATFERDGIIAFSGTRRKIVSLRPTTKIELVTP